MYWLYYAEANATTLPPSEYTIKGVSVRRKDRKFLTRLDYAWHLLALGKYRKFIVLADDGAIVHTSRVIGKCFKFPFLPNGAAEIGPCSTEQDYRGRGIYPRVLTHILVNGGYQSYYMLVHDTNTASIRGIEKAGFSRIGQVEKRHGRWVTVTNTQ